MEEREDGGKEDRGEKLASDAGESAGIGHWVRCMFATKRKPFCGRY